MIDTDCADLFKRSATDVQDNALAMGLAHFSRRRMSKPESLRCTHRHLRQAIAPTREKDMNPRVGLEVTGGSMGGL